MAEGEKKGLFEKIYKIVRKIPEGKVVTYGQISEIINSQFSISNEARGKITPRIVGFALHANKDPDTPCHRVVNKEGRLAPNFAGPQSPDSIASGRRAFAGPDEQRRRLQAEKVAFKDRMHVNLAKSQWHFARNPKH